MKTTKETFHELLIGYDYYEKGLDGNLAEEWFPMDRPIQCIASITTDFKGTERGLHYLNEEQKEKPESKTSDGHVIPKVEERGITLRQLRAVFKNIERRCVPEGWKSSKDGKTLLIPDTVTLYDVNIHIIKKFSEESQLSFVETLPSTAGPQPPRWFVSHWWGEPVKDFISCLETHRKDFFRNFTGSDERRGGGMTIDTPFWICAYANNQWRLDEEITKDPLQSSFTKAMKIAKGRTLSILDTRGIVFSRVWCVYELYFTLIDKDKEPEGVWAVYTAHKNQYKNWRGKVTYNRNAVGIISGKKGATSDRQDASYTAAREAPFPFELIHKSLTTTIETAEASKEEDRRRILNSIVGKEIHDLDTDPEYSHKKYTLLNTVLRATFASSYGTLQAALGKDKAIQNQVLDIMSKGTMTNGMEFYFEDATWKDLTTETAAQLITNLPVTIKSLYIFGATFGPTYGHALTEWIGRSTNLQFLSIWNSSLGNKEGGKEVGAKLAKILASNKTIKKLMLWRTDFVGSRNVSDWSNMLACNVTLESFECEGLSLFIKDVDPSSCKNNNVVSYHKLNGAFNELRHSKRAYFENGIFPDGMLTNEGVKILCKGIGLNSSLKRIKLWYHGICGDGITPAVGSALMKNSSILSVNLFEDGVDQNKILKISLKKLWLYTKERKPRIQFLLNSLDVSFGVRGDGNEEEGCGDDNRFFSRFLAC